MGEKVHLGILFGGRSCEHEVSVVSATSMLAAMAHDKYHVHLIGIDKSGYWHLGESMADLVVDGAVQAADGDASRTTIPVTLGLHHQGNLTHRPPPDPTPHTADSLPKLPELPALEVVFPMLHGTFGEDGAVQGVLEMAGLPYVGCGVVASAVAMDKGVAKQLLQAAGLHQARYVACHAPTWRQSPAAVMAQVARDCGYPVFVKPANMGSSVGISKVKEAEQLAAAIDAALRFDHKVVIEQAMLDCHEIECAILGLLGDENLAASVLGEIIPSAEFYDYHTKYIDDQSQLIVPAPLDPTITARVQQLAVEAFTAIDGRGLARVDFFVARDGGEITINEINTLPGFTPISMYPRLWAASGVPYAELVDRLIELALHHHQAQQTLQRGL